MLAGQGPSTWMVANALLAEIPLRAIVVEKPVNPWVQWRRRAARLGWRIAAGQLLFSIYARQLRNSAAERAAQIIRESRLDTRVPQGVEILCEQSVNSESAIALLRELAPRVVVVNGTRILSRRVLESIDAVFLNMHVGITPKYRGVHGGYWALANGDRENAGVTVHLVSPGIDTGAIVYQDRIAATPRDNFTTYPLLQIAAGIPLMKRAIADALAGRLRTQPTTLPSRLYYLPTLRQYLAGGVR